MSKRYFRFPFLCSITIALALSATSCLKESADDPKEKVIAQPKSSDLDIGTQHNLVLEYALSGIDFSVGSDHGQRAISRINELRFDFSMSTITQSEFIDLSLENFHLMDSIEYDLDKWTDNPYSQEATEIMKNIVSALQNVDTITNVINILNYFESLKDATRVLSKEESEIMLGAIEISKSSSLFWSPKSIGGLDYYNIVHSGDIPQARWSWGGAVLGDAVASLTFWTNVGVAGAVFAVTPGANAVLFTGWAVSAAIGSVAGGLF